MSRLRFGLEALIAIAVAAVASAAVVWTGLLPLIPRVLAVLLVSAAAAWWLMRSAAKRFGELESAGELLLRSESTDESKNDRRGSFAGVLQVLNRLAEQADERVAAAEAESEQLKGVVGGMSEGVLVTDSNGRVTFVNPQWLELFSVSGEIEGASVVELSRQTALDRMLTVTLETDQSQQIELEVTDPTPKTLILTSAPLSEGGGVVVVAQDVTAVLRLTEIRRDFVANVSHELKTPLSAIRGFAETLALGAKDDPRAAKRFLKRILKQCTRLEALLSDLLTLSHLEHAADRGRKLPTDLAEIVIEVAEEIRERAAKKKVVLKTDVRAVPPIEGDAGALERLCVNLLDNAVKYNHEGGEIQVRLFSSAGQVVLEVEDTGIGIPETSLDRLFERFYRVDKGRSRQEGGTGLGLAIVKHATNLHGGKVEVESELGRGSLFRVWLPPARDPVLDNVPAAG
ncbi:MAG: sensor histidine kinase [Thermoanaerobaculia bacterium]